MILQITVDRFMLAIPGVNGRFEMMTDVSWIFRQYKKVW
jgi:hypothetical protein